MERLDEYLEFGECMPPPLSERKLEKLSRRRNEGILIILLSIASFIATAAIVGLAAAVMHRYPAVGAAVFAAMAVCFTASAALAAAMLKREEKKKYPVL